MTSAILLAGVTGSSIVSTQHVYADTTAVPSDGNTGSVTITGNQLQNLFTTTGKASIDNKNGQVSLVPGNAGFFSSAEAGSVYMNGNIDMSKSFDLSLYVNFATKRQLLNTKSDGSVFAFRPGDPTVVGNPGSGMGIGGIRGAFGVTLDTYHNNDNQYARSYKDPSADPYISFFQNNYDGNPNNFNNVNSGGGDTLTGPEYGYAKQWIDNTGTGGKGAQSVSKSDLGDSAWLPLDISYNGDTHQLTYTLKNNGGSKVIATDTYDFSDRIKLYGDYMNLSISSGDSYASQASANIRFDKLTLNPVAVTNVHYVDTDGNQVAPTDTVNTPINPNGATTETIAPKDIDGYELNHVDGPAEYDTDSHVLTIDGGATLNGDLLKNITFYYKKVETGNPTDPTDPSNPGNGVGSTNPGNSGDTGNGGNDTTPNQTGDTPSQTGDIPNWAAVKGQSVYGIKGFYLYKNANFNKNQRIKTYKKAIRVNRPQFVVKNYKRDAKGNLRYYVQQYNPATGKYVKGTSGYITANQKYVVKAYYQSVPKNKQIKIINKNGVKAYKNVKLSGKAKFYKKGSILKVKSVKSYKLTTRYQLTNGQYVTGNKKFVIWK